MQPRGVAVLASFLSCYWAICWGRTGGNSLLTQPSDPCKPAVSNHRQVPRFDFLVRGSWQLVSNLPLADRPQGSKQLCKEGCAVVTVNGKGTLSVTVH